MSITRQGAIVETKRKLEIEITEQDKLELSELSFFLQLLSNTSGAIYTITEYTDFHILESLMLDSTDEAKNEFENGIQSTFEKLKLAEKLQIEGSKWVQSPFLFGEERLRYDSSYLKKTPNKSQNLPIGYVLIEDQTPIVNRISYNSPLIIELLGVGAFLLILAVVISGGKLDIEVLGQKIKVKIPSLASGIGELKKIWNSPKHSDPN